MPHDKAACLFRFFFDRLCRLAGLVRGLGSMACGLCRMPSRLTGAFGGGIFLFDGLLLLPAGKGVAGKLGVLRQGLLVQGVDVCFFQLLLRPCRFAVGFQFMAAVSLPHQPRADFNSLPGLVRPFHAHIVLFGLADFLMRPGKQRVGRSAPYRMGQLGGRPCLFLKGQFRCFLSGIGVNNGLPDLLFGYPGLRLVCPDSCFLCAADRLFQRRVGLFLPRKAQARLLNQTIPPASASPSYRAVPHRGPCQPGCVKDGGPGRHRPVPAHRPEAPRPGPP